jgi:hypothetical protein
VSLANYRRFSLRFERAEYMVGVVFDHIINVATLGAALGSRLNIKRRSHARLDAMDALKSSQQAHRIFDLNHVPR